MKAILKFLTLCAIFGHSRAFIQQTPFSSPFFDPSSSIFSKPTQCVQQVVDADTLTRVIEKLIREIPNICLSKFKLCGGFQSRPPPMRPSEQDPPIPPNMEWLFNINARNPDADADAESSEPELEDIVEEVFVDANGTETKSSKPRQRRSAEYPRYPKYGGGYPKYGGGEEYPKYGGGYPKYGGGEEYPKYGGGYPKYGGGEEYPKYGGGYPKYGGGYPQYGGEEYPKYGGGYPKYGGEYPKYGGGYDYHQPSYGYQPQVHYIPAYSGGPQISLASLLGRNPAFIDSLVGRDNPQTIFIE